MLAGTYMEGTAAAGFRRRMAAALGNHAGAIPVIMAILLAESDYRRRCSPTPASAATRPRGMIPGAIWARATAWPICRVVAEAVKRLPSGLTL